MYHIIIGFRYLLINIDTYIHFIHSLQKVYFMKEINFANFHMKKQHQVDHHHLMKENASSQFELKALFNKDGDILLMFTGLPSNSSCMETL